MSSNLSRLMKCSALAAAMLVASGLAHAAATPYFGVQGPKADLSSATPPNLAGTAATANAGFTTAAPTVLNQGPLAGEFENAVLNNGAVSFGYEGGTATVSGAALVNANCCGFDSRDGRYNTTRGLPELFPGVPDAGSFLETKSDTRLSEVVVEFSTAVTAFSFLATDVGDFGLNNEGSFSVEYYLGAGKVWDSGKLVNTQSGPVAQPNSSNTIDSVNGNLLFYGVTIDGGFDRVVFKIVQAGTDQNFERDRIGLDSFVVARAASSPPGTVPEPGSLALAGLALLGVAAARRQTRRA